MADPIRRPPGAHPANAPGDFYVEDQCCTLCGVPQVLAPELFSTDEESAQESHCYVRRQPATETEVDSMLKVISGAELQCIRYAGADPSILDRLTAAGESAVCDALPQRPQPSIHDYHRLIEERAALPLFENFNRSSWSDRLKRWLRQVLRRSS